MRSSAAAVLVVLAAGGARPGAADIYDLQTQNDNLPTTTRLELTHGTEQWHDLAAVGGVADEDWYRIRQQPYSSYEVVVDGASGDLGSFRLARMAPDGVTILQQGAAAGLGLDRTLRFVNNTAAAIDTQYIVVRGAACSTACGSDDVYRIRMRETTGTFVRYNNSGTQVTILLIQNPTAYAVTGTALFWNATGTAAGSSAFTLAPKALLVLNTSSVVPATSGSVTVVHDARYGDLAGKAIAMEPSTGFEFETVLQHRPH